MSQTRVCAQCRFRNQPLARFCGMCGARIAVFAPQERELQPALEPFAPGDVLGPAGRYQVDRLLGKGGFGEAYLVEDTHLARLCVVKRLCLTGDLDAGQQQNALAAFAREAQLLVSLSNPGHPNIPEIFEYLPDEHCLVMKYVTGRDLWKVLKSRPDPLPEAEALRYVRDVCSALAYMHSRSPQPVLHADLKPQNIMLDEIGRVWLIDFGLARRVAAEHLRGSPGVTSVDGGTPGYAPPEQWAGRAEPRSDVYALGATLYALLSGRRPPAAAGPPRVALRALNPDVRPQVERLIERTMALEVGERPSAALLLAELDELLASANVPPPPDPAPLPLARSFVGRTAELAELAQQLHNTGFVALSGMPGVGKTALAAQLAQLLVSAEHIFWYAFRAGEGAEALIWRLAGWLALQGQGRAWKLLNQARQDQNPLPAPEIFVDQLIQLAAGQGYLLCFDDCHLVDEAPAIAIVLGRLLDAARNRKLMLIFSSRSTRAAGGAATHSLRGLDLPDTAELLAGAELLIDAELTGALQAATEGNPQLLILATALLRDAPDPAAVISRLPASDSIERYLLEELDEQLGADERLAMEAIAVLLGYGGTRSAIEAVADGRSMRRVLAALLRRHLLSVEHRSAEPVYQQHAIVQQFYYETPARRERQAMHARAAAYYEQEQAALPAVRHYGLAGEHARAAAIVADQPWRLVQQDHAGAVSEALAAIVLDGLDGALRAGVRSAQAEAAVLLGEYRSARSLLEQAIADGNAVKGPGVVRQARRHRLLAIACERTGAYEQAEAACRRGLALAETGSGPRSESARLYAQLAEILLRRSAFAEAAEACRAGLAALPPEPAMPAERSNLLQRLATIEGQRDSYLPALELFEQSLDLARQAGDPLLMGLVLHNMGHAYYTLGQLERAVLCYNESLRFKAEIGDVAGRLRTLGNLGLIHMARGDNPAARHAFAESCELSEQYGLIEQQALARSNLGTLAYEEGDLITARAQIDATAGLYSRLGDPGGQAFCYYMLGDINLAEGNTVAALDSGQRALELARQAGRRPIESCALRVLGEVMLAQGQLAEADIVLAAAWALAEPVGDPYDQALILAAQARLARAGADSGSARHHAERSLILARANGIAHVQAHMEQVLHELDTPDPT